MPDLIDNTVDPHNAFVVSLTVESNFFVIVFAYQK